MAVVQRRRTTQRAAVTARLLQVAEFVSAQDLHAQLRADGSTIGLATVYRTLQEFAEAGEIDSVRNESGEVLYRLCAQPRHHHHLVCRICGDARELSAPAVERWAQGVAQEHGFIDVSHDIELFGVCANCSAPPA